MLKIHVGRLALIGVLLYSVWTISLADPGHAPIGGPVAYGNALREIVVTQYDHSFEPKIIEVKSRESVLFVIQNKGQAVHEFMIGTPMMHIKHQQELRTLVEQGLISHHHIDHDKITDHLHSERAIPSRHHYDLSSVLLEPGETKTLAWKFPHSGPIQFACNMPGHYQAGMLGEFLFDE